MWRNLVFVLFFLLVLPVALAVCAARLVYAGGHVGFRMADELIEWMR